MASVPATVTIPQLPQGTTVNGAELFEAVQTSNGIANSVQLTLAQMMGTVVGALPTGGGAGAVLVKNSNSNFDTGWLSFAANGVVVGNGAAAPSVIAATTAGLVLMAQGSNAAPAYALVNLNTLTSVTGNPWKPTTLVAGDGSTTDRSVGSVIWISHAINPGAGNNHSFSDSSSVTWSNSGFGSNAYDDETLVTTTTTSIAPNHHASYQSFATYGGPGTLSLLETINSALQVTGGTVSIVSHMTIQDVGVSGTGSVGNQYGIFINQLAGGSGTINRGFFSVGTTINESRGQWLISSGYAPPAGGTQTSGLILSNLGGFGIFFGTGAPSLSAATSSLYLRTDAASATTRLYINTNGLTSWASFTASA